MRRRDQVGSVRAAAPQKARFGAYRRRRTVTRRVHGHPARLGRPMPRRRLPSAADAGGVAARVRWKGPTEVAGAAAAGAPMMAPAPPRALLAAHGAARREQG